MKDKCLPVYCLVCFSLVLLSAAYCVFLPYCPQITEAGTKGAMSYNIWMHRMRELLYQERSVHHLDFSPMKGILCVPLYSLIAFEMKFFLATELIGR